MDFQSPFKMYIRIVIPLMFGFNRSGLLHSNCLDDPRAVKSLGGGFSLFLCHGKHLRGSLCGEEHLATCISSSLCKLMSMHHCCIPKYFFRIFSHLIKFKIDRVSKANH